MAFEYEEKNRKILLVYDEYGKYLSRELNSEHRLTAHCWMLIRLNNEFVDGTFWMQIEICTEVESLNLRAAVDVVDSRWFGKPAISRLIDKNSALSEQLFKRFIKHPWRIMQNRAAKHHFNGLLITSFRN